MSRRPLAADLWEQSLLNGRRIHPSDDAAALRWAEQWYATQGGEFAGQAPAPQPLANLEPVENTMPDSDFEALMLQSDHGPGPAEPEGQIDPEVEAEAVPEAVEESIEPEPVKASKPRRRTRHGGSWDGGDAA